MEVLFGLHPVEEAIRSGARRLDHVSVARERHDAGAGRAGSRGKGKAPEAGKDPIARILQLCRETDIRVDLEPREQLTRLAKTDTHQGVVAFLRDRQFLALEDLLVPRADGRPWFFLALDGVEDPHNLGALLRSADGAGVDGVILPERRAAPVTATVAKSSAGASEHIRIARVTNLVRSLEQLKQHNVWILGLDERGTPDYTGYDFNTHCCLVLGREGAGLHDLVKKTCDHLLRIPMAGQVSSLNVSVAGAVVMYEAVRQRQQPLSPPTRSVKPRKGLGS